jgi:hypothetical protein
MTEIDAIDSMAYGFRLLGYLVGVLVVGFAVAVLGAELFGSVNPLLGDLVMVVGIAVILAGLLGMQHKVIVDSVARGMDGSTDSSGGTLPDGLSVLRVQRRDGQKASDASAHADVGESGESSESQTG